MIITFLTIFPEMIKNGLNYSIPARAEKSDLVKYQVVNLRDFGVDKHGNVDDSPYGGGPGMILRVDVAVKALESIDPDHTASRILLSPDGEIFSQEIAVKLAHECKDLIFICGRYEGFDSRIEKYVDRKISVGRYVLSGGELAAMTITDAVTRLIPGVLGNSESLINETFNDNLTDFPQFTRPEVFRNEPVPEVLLSGHHAQIESWRKEHQKKIGKIDK